MQRRRARLWLNGAERRSLHFPFGGSNRSIKKFRRAIKTGESCMFSATATRSRSSILTHGASPASAPACFHAKKYSNSQRARAGRAGLWRGGGLIPCWNPPGPCTTQFWWADAPSSWTQGSRATVSMCWRQAPPGLTGAECWRPIRALTSNTNPPLRIIPVNPSPAARPQLGNPGLGVRPGYRHVHVFVAEMT